MERGFFNPQEYADKNVRAPFDSKLRALRVLRGEISVSILVAALPR
jgi:hypothetical protein